jgi:hypothetical protein
MRPSHTEDPLHPFTLELLRTGYALHEMATEVADALASDENFEDDAGLATMQMISGSIQTFLEEADERDVDRATELISGAVGRVIEHLRLALELHERMDGTGPLGRGYDDPLLEAEMVMRNEAGMGEEMDMQDAAELLAGAPDPPSGPTGELAEALVHCGGLLSQVVAQVIRWDGGVPEGDVPIPDGACRLVAALLSELEDCFSEEEVGAATRVVEALTESLTEDVYFVDPDFADSGFFDSHSDSDEDEPAGDGAPGSQ